MLSFLSHVTTFLTRIAPQRKDDDRGATAVEYGLMVALIAIVTIAGVTLLGTNLLALATAMARRQSTTARLALSPREREVLALLRDGESIPTIARTLYVSPSTAKTYVSRLYEKLGASNRSQALMSALRKGLIRSDAALAPTRPWRDARRWADARRSQAERRATRRRSPFAGPCRALRG